MKNLPKKLLLAGALLGLLGAGCTPDKTAPVGTLKPDAGRNVVGTAQVDLNGDGTPEQVSLALVSDAEHPSKHPFLTVGDKSVDIVEQTNPVGFFGIVSLGDTNPETGRTRRAIALDDEGPSSDPTTRFYTFESDHIAYLGEAGGFYENMVFKGDGTFTTRSRGKILDTWFHEEAFKLENGKIVAVPQDLYWRKTPVTMRMPLSLVKSPKESGAAFQLQTGDMAIIDACDNVAWCRIDQGGRQGWFKVVDGGNVIVDGKSMPAGQVFDGLSNAD